MKFIEIKKAAQNNLKNIDLKIPLESLTVVCGLSGSGKSSLAFETLYAEGQRRYLENLSNYIKQYVVQQKRPKVESISNLPPALALEQKNSIRSSRSTVATLSGLSDHLRLIFEHLAEALCPEHKTPLQSFSPTLATSYLLKHQEKQKGYLLVPVNIKQIHEFKHFLKELHQAGFLRCLFPSKTGIADGKMMMIDEIKKPPKQDFFIVVDRIIIDEKQKGRLRDSLFQAFHMSRYFSTQAQALKDYILFVSLQDERTYFSSKSRCPTCSFQLTQAISHALFSFNSPLGACKNCQGYGFTLKPDYKKIIPNSKLSLNQGAIRPLSSPIFSKLKIQLKDYCLENEIPYEKPWEELSDSQKQKVLSYPKGLPKYFSYLEGRRHKMHVRILLARYRSHVLCESCKGTRLTPEIETIFLKGKTYNDYMKMSLKEVKETLETLSFSKKDFAKCRESFEALKNNINYLNAVGLSYLTLNRTVNTLSGGELQRLYLSNQLGLRLSQVLYVLDEPTVGLHPRDTQKMIELLKDLRNLGNTVVVVEHDPDMIENSDYIIEMGPQSGKQGGQVVWSGWKKDFSKAKNSKTLSYLNRTSLLIQEKRPVCKEDYKYALRLEKASGHNLKNINLFIPLNRFVVVTGVSGSGKSSLISETLYPALAQKLHDDFSKESLEYKKLSGAEYLKAVVLVDQANIRGGRRSFIASYFQFYSNIRNMLAATAAAQRQSFKPSDFSLNVEGGRCPFCKGLGYQEIDMVFMDSIQILCDECQGKRFKKEVLMVQYQGKNIDEILNLTLDEAIDFFKMNAKMSKAFSALKEVGLSYLTLGQNLSSLSGGEKQRLKMAKEILEANQDKTLYIFDEPTKGLHFEEIDLLLKVLNKLLDVGASILVIEHNLEIIKEADYIIDIGPEAGAKGGKILVEGCKEKVMTSTKSHTAEHLKKYLKKYQSGL